MKFIDMGRCICGYVMFCVVFDNTPRFLINAVQLPRKFTVLNPKIHKSYQISHEDGD